MTIIPFSTIQRPYRICLFLLILVFCSLPVQHRFKGIFRSFSHTSIPTDLLIPAHFSKSIYFYLTEPLLLLFAAALIWACRPSIRSLLWTGPSKALSLLCLTGLVSIALSKTGHYPLPYIRLIPFGLACLLFGVISSPAFRVDRTQRMITIFAWILLGIGCLETALALCQYFTQDMVGLRSWGELHPTRFRFPSSPCPLYLGGALQEGGYLCRASGTFSHPNILGAFLSSSLLATSYLYIKQTQVARQIGLLALLSLQLLALLTSFSRSALLAFISGFLFLCVILFKHREAIPQLMRLGSGVLISCAAWVTLLFPALLARGGILNYKGVVQEADLERIAYAKTALALIQQHPLFGVGFNNFQLYTQPGLHSKVHNIYLLIGSEMGLIGAGLFLIFLASVLLAAFKRLIAPHPLVKEKIFLLSAFLALLLIGCCDFFLITLPAAAILFFGIAGFLYRSSLRSDV